jgi:hypothetical protein
MRRVAVVVALLAGLAAAPAAPAWTTLSSGVVNIVVPSLLVTRAGTELVSFDAPSADTISVARAGGAPKVIVANDRIAGETQLVQQPNGAIQLYFPDLQGVGRMTSTDDGNTWTGPIQTQSHDVAGVSGAAVGPDGTPYFAQSHTDAVNVFRGLNGDAVSNVYAPCCGYDASLAVDASGLVQVAFYSNAPSRGAFVYEPLDESLAPTPATSLEPTVEHTPSVPLVSDRAGNTFMAWAPGNPTATALSVVPFRGGTPAGDGVSFRGAFAGGDPHMALSVDLQDRLWLVWTGGNAVHVARSRTHGMDFGAVVSAAVPGTAYEVAAVGVSGNPGAVDVIVNVGPSLLEQQLRPGLSVRLAKKPKKVGGRTLVTWFAQALDDGFGVARATFRAHGRTLRANASGRVQLLPFLRHTTVAVAAPGYAGTRLRTP